MKYFFDTEFIEDFEKSGRERHFIDLISIGIIADDGRAYYAISNEFSYHDASDWVKQNVIQPMYDEELRGEDRNKISIEEFNKNSVHSKSLKEISKDIVEFINPNIKDLIYTFTRHDSWLEVYYKKEFEYIRQHNTYLPDHYYQSGQDGYEKNKKLIYNQPEFYGYFADYDWVLFCSLFGKMIDLPKGFPMYCRDLKQMIDEAVEALPNTQFFELFHIEAPVSLKEKLKIVKARADYPKQDKEHNALDDAKWNKNLYYFIQKLK